MAQNLSQKNAAETIIDTQLMLVTDPDGKMYKATVAKVKEIFTGDVIEFTAGESSFPAVGASSYTNTAFANKKIAVFRGSILQSYKKGQISRTGNTINFNPALMADDEISIFIL